MTICWSCWGPEKISRATSRHTARHQEDNLPWVSNTLCFLELSQIICRILSTIVSTSFSKVRFYTKSLLNFLLKWRSFQLKRESYLRAGVSAGAGPGGEGQVPGEPRHGQHQRRGGFRHVPRGVGLDCKYWHEYTWWVTSCFQTAGILLEPATSFPYNLVGYLTSDIAYTYELFVEFERASEDCTSG